MSSRGRSWLNFAKSRIFGGSQAAVNLSTFQVLEAEVSGEKSWKSLSHYIKLNHINHGVLHDAPRLSNHIPYALGSAFFLGADEKQLEKVYEKLSENLDEWKAPPGEVSKHDWTDYLGKAQYQRGYLDFFEDELAANGYDWKALTTEYMFRGEQPLAGNLVSRLGHPLIHLGFALELASRDVAMEALCLAASSANSFDLNIDGSEEPSWTTSDIEEIFEKLNKDQRIQTGSGANVDSSFDDTVGKNLNLLTEYAKAWEVKEPQQQFQNIQKLSASMLSNGKDDSAYNLEVAHLLMTSHALRVILPMAPNKAHILLLKQWLLLAIVICIRQGNMGMQSQPTEASASAEKDWEWVLESSRSSLHISDAHFANVIWALKVAGETWKEDDAIFLDAASRFVQNFHGWTA